MAITKLENLIPWIAQHLPMASDPVLKQALRDAWRDFCQRSDWWRPPVDISLVADQQSYTYAPNVDATVKRIVSIHYRDESTRDQGLAGTELLEGTDFVTEQQPSGDFLIRLAWAPGAAKTNALRVRAVLIPKLATKENPDDVLIDLWGETLANGAIARLAGQSGKAYSSAQTFQLAREQFDRGLALARRMNINGFGPNNAVVIP